MILGRYPSAFGRVLAGDPDMMKVLLFEELADGGVGPVKAISSPPGTGAGG